MENKYYTPELEEFCKGFEYEQLGPKNEWVKSIWDFHQFSEGRFLSLLHTPAWVRVKYLDKEDIESFGFVNTFDEKGYVAQYFIKEKESLNIYIKYEIIKYISIPNFIQNEKICIKRKIVDLRCETKEEVKDDIVFNGVIKNKSEFKKLLTQLEIL